MIQKYSTEIVEVLSDWSQALPDSVKRFKEQFPEVEIHPWDTLEVRIHQQVGDERKLLGIYARNYTNFFNTFHPFIKDGKEYALYSSFYTATRVMELPSCRDIGGEVPNDDGFCPVDYFVPHDLEKGLNGQIGFVAGCHWGDDLDGMKIQFLDLSEIEKGVIRREPRFGRVLLPNGISMQQAIDLDSYDAESRLVWIATAQPFDL